MYGRDFKGFEDEQASATRGKETKDNWVMTNWHKIVGLTFLLSGLLSIDYVNLTVSPTLLKSAPQLILVAFIDTTVLGYFVSASRWRGMKEWGAVFPLFYGLNYGLTAMKSIYLPSLLTHNVLRGLLIDGAIVSAVFAAAIVHVLGGKETQTTGSPRLVMRTREWVWKITAAGAVYMLLFILFGFAVYYPLARLLDPLALLQEQSAMGTTAAAWVLPWEGLRGAVWALLGVPAILALPFDRRKTAFTIGLLFATPMSGSILLSTAMSPGLRIAHLVEVFGENFVFGALTVWTLQLHSRLPRAHGKMIAETI